MTDPTPRFTGFFVPVEILEIEELSFFDTLLLSWIDALYCKDHGGCFASNEYLARKMKSSQPNTVAKSLTKLRKMKLIEDVSFDGRKRVVRALIGRHIENAHSNSGLDKNPSRVGQKSNPRLDKRPTPLYKVDIKDEIKEEKTSPPQKRQPPPSPEAKELCDFLLAHLRQRNPSFTIKSPKEWERASLKLLKQYPSLDTLKEVIVWVFEREEIRNADKWPGWKTVIMSPDGLYKNIEKIIEKMNSQKTAKRETPETNKALAHEIVKKYGQQAQGRNLEIYAAPGHLEFIAHGVQSAPLCISYDKAGFVEMVKSQLKTWRLT